MQNGFKKRSRSTRLLIFIAVSALIIVSLLVIILATAANNAKKAKIVAISTLSPSATPEMTLSPEQQPPGTAEPSQTGSAGDSASAGLTRISIKAVGDVAVQTDVLAGCYDSTTGEYSFSSLFAKISDSLNSDLTIASFETVCVDTGTAAYNGKGAYNTPFSIIDAIKGAGINAVTLANSHILDQGMEGITQTTAALDEAGISYFGAYNSQDEADTDKYSLMDIKGVKVAVLSYTEDVRGNLSSLTTAQQKYAVNIVKKDTIVSDISRVRAKGADVVIVCLHWGKLFTYEPSSEMRSLAESVLIAGADIVLGSHTQEVQRITTKTVTRSDGTQAQGIVAYCLGNFLSEYRDPRQDSGIILSVDIEKNMETGEVTVGRPSYTPTWIDRIMVNGTYQFEILKIKEYYDTPGSMTETSHTRMKKAWDEITGVISSEAADLSQ